MADDEATLPAAPPAIRCTFDASVDATDCSDMKRTRGLCGMAYMGRGEYSEGGGGGGVRLLVGEEPKPE